MDLNTLELCYSVQRIKFRIIVLLYCILGKQQTSNLLGQIFSQSMEFIYSKITDKNNFYLKLRSCVFSSDSTKLLLVFYLFTRYKLEIFNYSPEFSFLNKFSIGMYYQELKMNKYFCGMMDF
ncbi:unnamed protein product [Paramecium sonneborni]|uniref:Uncharacterized protein n=1 Tax=Paramecium sonneborni TaxID=65129 RepID=A0A8S1P3U1_9CILI|nr:unnamed protein product [Paramecium sonneborni]